ncbi:MAG: chemotaxis protein [Alphaproteobacteria bacterium]|nr:chemotaxis protein [Alphaproteobacteria bacterium]
MHDKSKKSLLSFNGKNRSIFMAISALWLFVCAAYISVYSGWENIMYFMPHEFFIILLVVALPLIVFGLVIVITQVTIRVDSLRTDVGQLSQRDGIATEALALISQTIRESREAQIEAQEKAAALLVDATRDSRQAIIEELRSQGGMSRDISRELALSAQKLAPVVASDSVQSIDRMRSLAELLTLALNDLSMTATQLLTDLLSKVQDDKETVRKFISTLTDAYFAGDRNVFFRCLALEVKAHSDKFREMAAGSDTVGRRVSKILREAGEIKTLVAQCNPNDLIRIVFEDGDLWDLEKILVTHFADDGSLKSA